MPTIYKLEKGSITLKQLNTTALTTILGVAAVLCELVNMWSLEERDCIDKCQDFGFLLSRAVQVFAPPTVFLT